MKILLLSAYLISANFFQQDATSATSGKRTERNVSAQPAQSTALSATRSNQPAKQKAKAKHTEPASATSSPAKTTKK
jgi:hypothetical protein